MRDRLTTEVTVDDGNIYPTTRLLLDGNTVALSIGDSLAKWFIKDGDSLVEVTYGIRGVVSTLTLEENKR